MNKREELVQDIWNNLIAIPHNKNKNRRKMKLELKYWLVLWIGCCFLLGSMFYLEIQHQKRVDKIFENYYKEIGKL